MDKNHNADWFVYIIEADDGSYYTGISTDVERRFDEHSGKSGGAKYFNGRRPVSVVHREAGFNRSSATRREAQIKKMNRQQKLALINT
ncbi:MAG: GIY-YIG nuclease family protein [Gammaproteobacteria bacterium]|nr:GIY-YIG nuclease family protein [Gammaproteobacteria bacterium]